MRSRHLAAARYWHDLVGSAEQAGASGVDLDSLGYVAMEFALGVLALDFKKDELLIFLAGRVKEVASGRLAVARFGEHGFVREDDWSDITSVGGFGSADPRLREALIAQLARVRAAAPPSCSPGDLGAS